MPSQQRSPHGGGLARPLEARRFSHREAPQPEIAPDTFDIIGRILKARYGFILESYKDNCVKRRINLRITATLSASPEAYAELLTNSAAEQERLMTVLTIHVSQFFRNPSTFKCLADTVIPALLDSREPREPLGFWSAGCAGGEEPYTLALIMKEIFPAQTARRRLSIVGTDVDRTVLESARAAIYGRERMAEVSDELRDRWFLPDGERFRLCREVRSLVSFQEGDLHRRECFVESDLILCRNVLIYLERERQEAILKGFTEVLRPGGFLVLGKSETLPARLRRRFETVCPVERIYRIN